MSLLNMSSDFKSILNSLPINVLTCDPKTFVIDYANKSSINTLNEIQDLLPDGVSGNNIVGQCIDVFHQNPSHQRNLLADKSIYPHSAVIRLGHLLLDLYIEEMPSSGKLVLSWSVCTERERLKIMSDNMPINIMMADPKTLEINYINQTSINTLKGIENLLPVKADDMLGTCIDVFHKNPEHQRKLLGDPNNLPWNSKISIGENILQLNVAAIKDKSGYYIGPMVSWSVITDQENLSKNVLEISKTVSTASAKIEENAKSLENLSQDSLDKASTVAQAATQASSNVQSVAAATEQMSASIKEISSQVSKSTATSNEAVEKAQQAKEVIRVMSESSQEIGNVSNIINDIAEQTNLLALNATIEAARAGEAGKGFAVVASEVKTLASETTKATTEIQAQIVNMQKVTQEAVEAIDLIHKTINDIAASSNSIAAAIEEQSSATAEISHNVQQTSSATTKVSENIKSIEESSEETKKASSTLLDLAMELSKNSEEMDRQVNDFVNKN